MPGGQKHVHQPGDPGPVRRAPEAVTRLRQEVVRELDARQMAQQRAVGVQRALGRARGPGGVDEQRGVVGARRRGHEPLIAARQQVVEAVGPAVPAGGGHHNVPQRRQAFQYRLDPGQCVVVHDHETGAAVTQPVFEGVWTEQAGHRNGYGAQLVRREVGHGSFGPLRQDDSDPVASSYAEPRQGVGQPVAQAPELPEGVLDDGIRLLVVVNQRGPGGSRRVPVTDVDRDVVEPGHLPPETVVRLPVVPPPLQQLRLLQLEYSILTARRGNKQGSWRANTARMTK